MVLQRAVNKILKFLLKPFCAESFRVLSQILLMKGVLLFLKTPHRFLEGIRCLLIEEQTGRLLS